MTKPAHNALQTDAKQQTTRRLESEHRNAYKCHPVGKEEFSVQKEDQNWEGEENWGDA